jgi:GntR family transcriptional regulator/MocR family aminotransferase
MHAVLPKGHVDWSSALEQLTLAEFIASGAYARHVRSNAAALPAPPRPAGRGPSAECPGIRVTGMAAGLQAVLELPRGTERSVMQAAARQGLAVSGMAEFRYEVEGSGWQLPEQDALVVGYALPRTARGRARWTHCAR